MAHFEQLKPLLYLIMRHAGGNKSMGRMERTIDVAGLQEGYLEVAI